MRQLFPCRVERLITDGAESLLRLKRFPPIPTRCVLGYFHAALKARHIDQCISRISPCRFLPDRSIFELYDQFNYLRGYLWSGRRTKFKESFDRLLWLLDRKQCRSGYCGAVQRWFHQLRIFVVG